MIILKPSLVSIHVLDPSEAASSLQWYIWLLRFLNGQISHSCSPLLYIKYINSKTQLTDFSRPDMLIQRSRFSRMELACHEQKFLHSFFLQTSIHYS